MKPGARSCDTCAQRGIDLSRPGQLYVVSHVSYGAVKLGIPTSGARVAQHLSQGWTLAKSWNFPRAEEAWSREEILLAWIRRAGIPPGVTQAQMPYRGWTETAPLELLAVDVPVEGVERLLADGGLEPLAVVGPPLPVHPRTRRQLGV